MRVEFTKMHGLGNDFIVIDARERAFNPSPELWRRLADRHTGIGFDQALLLERPQRPGTVAFYRIFNSNGKEVEQCGNGARCIAALLAPPAADEEAPADIVLESSGGLVRAHREGALFAVDLGVPDFSPAALAFANGEVATPFRLEIDGALLELALVSIGNPHAVLTVPDVAAAQVARLGSAIESHARFRNGVNVGFMQILDRGSIWLRVHERGAGETLACGTGACAAVAVGQLRGELDPAVQVSTRGGQLRVNWAGPGEHIWLTGPAQVAFVGYIEV